MGVCVIRGLVAATFLIALGQLRGVKSTPVFLEPNTANGVNTAILDTSRNVTNPSGSEQRNPNSENGEVNTVTISNNEDDDTTAEYSGDFNYYSEDSSGDFADGDYGGNYSDAFADFNGTSYEYDYDYDNTSSTEDYSEQNRAQYDNDDDDDTDLEYGDDYSENDDSEEDDDDYDDDDYDDDEGDDNDDDDDDYNNADEGHGQPSHHHHHLITGQNGASIEVDDDGKVYMFLKVNETFDPTKYYLEVGNNTKLLLDLGEVQGNVTADYEFVPPTNPDGEEEGLNGTAGDITLLSSSSADKQNVHGPEEQGVVLLNVADLPEDSEGSNNSIANQNSTINNETTTLSVQGKGDSAVTNSTENYGTTLKDQENKMPTFIPRVPNDTHISVGWSSATVSDESTTESSIGKMSHENSSLLVSRTPSSIDLPHLTTTINYLDGLEENDDDLVEYAEEEGNHDENGHGDLDEASEDEVTKSLLDMDDDELKTFLASNPDLIESDNEEYEANITEPEMTTSALMLDPHRDVIENVNASESPLASLHADLDEEELTETQPEGDDLTWFLISSENVNLTNKTSVNNTDIDYGRLYQEFMESYNLTNEERLELGDLERLRRATESLGGLSTLREDQTKHHVVRRQLKGTEACGSFSRRRRDTGATDKVNSEGQRHKRGVSNVGRRLEMGNPAFRQLYNQYKNMCNFIAMVAFEK